MNAIESGSFNRHHMRRASSSFFSRRYDDSASFSSDRSSSSSSLSKYGASIYRGKYTNHHYDADSDPSQADDCYDDGELDDRSSPSRRSVTSSFALRNARDFYSSMSRDNKCSIHDKQKSIDSDGSLSLSLLFYFSLDISS